MKSPKFNINGKSERTLRKCGWCGRTLDLKNVVDREISLCSKHFRSMGI